MTIQQRLDATLHLLRTVKNWKHRQIVERTKDIISITEVDLSKAKSTSESKLTSGKEQPILTGLEQVLLEDLGIHYDESQGKYFDAQGDVVEFDDAILSKEGTTELPTVYDRMPIPLINDLIQNAKTVRILDTFLDGVVQLNALFRKVLENEGTVQLLLVHPDRAAARLRDRSLRSVPDIDVGMSVKKNKAAFAELERNYPDRFEIRNYNNLPGPNLFLIDEQIFCGWYWYQRTAVEGPFLHLQKNKKEHSILNDAMEQHWKKLWRDHQPNKPDAGNSRYWCHFIRKGKLEKFLMTIFHHSGEVKITDTDSGTRYAGSINILNNYCRITASSIETSAERQRIASFLVRTGFKNALKDQELVLATYSNISPSGEAFANIVILEKEVAEFGNTSLKTDKEIDEQNRRRKEKREKQKKFRKYLQKKEVRIPNLNISSYQSFLELQDMEQKNANLADDIVEEGLYYLFFVAPQGNKGTALYLRQLRVLANGYISFFRQEDSKMDYWEMTRISLRSISIRRVEDDAGDGHHMHYVLKRNGRAKNEYYGYATGLSSIGEPKSMGIFMFKPTSSEYNPKENRAFPLPLSDEDNTIVQNLKNGLDPKFTEIVMRDWTQRQFTLAPPTSEKK